MVKEEESILYFVPPVAWKRGTYILETESRLEDMAGNNLNRLFDVDLATSPQEADKAIHKRVFYVK
jgi:hypothetical protein